MDLPLRGAYEATYSFGFMPAGLFFDESRPPGTNILPDAATLITYQFFHAGVNHLLSNMVFLFIFGGPVEDRFRHAGFLGLFLATGATAGLAHGMAYSDDFSPLVGASGAVAGVLGAYIVLYPRAKVTLLGPLFIPFRLRAWIAIGIWFGLQLLMTEVGQTGVAWWAHIGGFVAGLAVGLFVRRKAHTP